MTISETTIVNRLVALAQLDMDAVLAYDQAIIHVDEHETGILDAFDAFQADHLRHIEEIGTVLADLDHPMPALSRDVKGFFIENVTALMGKLGTRATLVAMTQNELLTNATYKAALALDLPPAARVVVHRGYDDEQRHLAVVKQALKEKFGLDSDAPEAPVLAGIQAGLHGMA